MPDRRGRDARRANSSSRPWTNEQLDACQTTDAPLLTRAAGKPRHFELLDVGFGRAICARDRAVGRAKRGFSAGLVGVDLNPKSASMAEAPTSSA
jgi:hypothetical protein